jgi:hypothetical protein
MLSLGLNRWGQALLHFGHAPLFARATVPGHHWLLFGEIILALTRKTIPERWQRPTGRDPPSKPCWITSRACQDLLPSDERRPA